MKYRYKAWDKNFIGILTLEKARGHFLRLLQQELDKTAQASTSEGEVVRKLVDAIFA